MRGRKKERKLRKGGSGKSNLQNPKKCISVTHVSILVIKNGGSNNVNVRANGRHKIFGSGEKTDNNRCRLCRKHNEKAENIVTRPCLLDQLVLMN